MAGMNNVNKWAIIQKLGNQRDEINGFAESKSQQGQTTNKGQTKRGKGKRKFRHTNFKKAQISHVKSKVEFVNLRNLGSSPTTEEHSQVMTAEIVLLFMKTMLLLITYPKITCNF